MIHSRNGQGEGFGSAQIQPLSNEVIKSEDYRELGNRAARWWTCSSFQ
jgi:hypothetical protein